MNREDKLESALDELDKSIDDGLFDPYLSDEDILKLKECSSKLRKLCKSHEKTE